MDLKTINNNFMYHQVGEEQKIRMEKIRVTGKELALMINDFCNDGPEQTLAIRKIEEAIMWANAAIARE